VPSRFIVLVCLTVGASTFPVGPFPALLPEIERAAGLSDQKLGALAAAFGFARMVVDVPVGFFVARHLPAALILSPVLLSAGILIVASGGPFPVLLGGRIVMGVAHSLGMVAWLTTILRYQSGRSLGAALNASEFTAMIGMLSGLATLAMLPKAWSWNHALLVSCAPQVVGIVLAPLLVRALDRHPVPLESSASADPVIAVGPPARDGTIALAFAAGAAAAVAYSTLESYMVPLRGGREFDLDRAGVAHLLMLSQATDLVALMPLGLLTDRIGASRVLPAITAVMALAVFLVSFGGFTAIVAGTALLGLGMAGWMLPLTVVRRETPPSLIAWRTALYRVGVDAGLFAGPMAAGLMGGSARLFAGVVVVALAALTLLLAVRARRTHSIS
jgi:predicted MFS family arabinose efflux permease